MAVQHSRVDYPTLSAFGALRMSPELSEFWLLIRTLRVLVMGLVRELNLEPIRVASNSGVWLHRSRLQGQVTVARPTRRLLAPPDVPSGSCLLESGAYSLKLTESVG